MLEPQIVAFLEQRHGPGLTRVQEPLVAETLSSSSAIQRLTLTETSGDRTTYVIKRLRPLEDWLARATRDDRMREYQFAASPISNALPARTGTALLHATLLDNGGAALIMRDVTDHLFPSSEPLTQEEAVQALEALASLHSTFYGFPARLMTAIAPCTLGSWLTLLSPAIGRHEATASEASVPAALIPGWDEFARLAPDAWHIIGPMLNNPQRLTAALRACPDTLIHGDASAEHLAFEAGRTLLLDWSLFARAPGALDLGWFLAINSSRLVLSHEAAIETYRAERERLRRLPSHGEQWERELALSLLAGAMRIGWALALGAQSEDERDRALARAELDWWTTATLAAERWL